MNSRPNILLLFSDQHHAKVLGHKGHPDVSTPHLDRLAAEGVRFDNAITQNPICTPSRTCWLSGQYCHNHGYYGLSGPSPGGLPTLFGHLRRHGYRTGAVGKIHCPEYWVEDDVDYFLDTCGTSIGGRSAAYADYLAERGLIDLEDHGAMQEFGAPGRQTCDARPSKVSYEDGQEGYLTRAGIDFMRRCADQGRPFFLQANFPKPHQCYTPAQPFWDRYDEAALTLPPNADHDLHGKAPHLQATVQRWRTTDWQLFEPRTFAAGRLRKLHGYLGNVSHVDHAVGEFLQFLDQAGLAEDTIVVYSSDHGDYAAEFGIMEKAPGICSDAITRVPFIWRWPGRFPAGRVAEELVESVDFATTACALAGVEAMETGDGHDLSHLLRGESGTVRRVAVTEFAFSKSVRKGRYRYVHYPAGMFARFGAEWEERGFAELYDLEADPWEQENLALLPRHRATVEELRADLIDWLVTTTRPTTVLRLPDAPTEQRSWRYGNPVNRDGKFNPRRVTELATLNYL